MESFSAFPPLVGENPDILVLGTFPSPLSRERGEYYGNPRNMFWRIICDVFANGVYAADYGDRKNIIYSRGVAVWDVIERCRVEGALDKNIKDPAFNHSLPDFIRTHGIKKVLFNGRMAHTFYMRGIGTADGDAVMFETLPSTSPANAGMRYEEKLSAWKTALSTKTPTYS